MTHPLPMHMLVTNIFWPFLFDSARAVAIWRAPVAPRGCPNAVQKKTRISYPSPEKIKPGKRTDSSTNRVDLGKVQPERLHAHDGLTRERLVDLPQVDLVLREPNLLEDLGDGERGTDAHELGGHAGDGGGAELSEDGEAELLGDGATGEEDSGGAVGDLRREGGLGWKGGKGRGERT